MKINKHQEATAFIQKLMVEFENMGMRPAQPDGTVQRELAAGLVVLDSVPAYSGTSEHKLDGSEAHAIYLSYEEPTDAQVNAALPAKMAGVKLQEIHGRIIGLRRCKDGTVQVLFSNGLRNADGKIPFRAPNVDKGILCALSFGEGLGVSVAEALELVPTEELDKLRAAKGRRGISRRDLADVAPGSDGVRSYTEELDQRTGRGRRVRREA